MVQYLFLPIYIFLVLSFSRESLDIQFLQRKTTNTPDFPIKNLNAAFLKACENMKAQNTIFPNKISFKNTLPPPLAVLHSLFGIEAVTTTMTTSSHQPASARLPPAPVRVAPPSPVHSHAPAPVVSALPLTKEQLTVRLFELLTLFLESIPQAL